VRGRDLRRVRISSGVLEKRGGGAREGSQPLFLGLLARVGRGEKREKRGEGNWEQCRVSRASWLPRNGLASCPLADSKMLRFCPYGV
jgi:hypothetical protein